MVETKAGGGKSGWGRSICKMEKAVCAESSMLSGGLTSSKLGQNIRARAYAGVQKNVEKGGNRGRP